MLDRPRLTEVGDVTQALVLEYRNRPAQGEEGVAAPTAEPPNRPEVLTAGLRVHPPHLRPAAGRWPRLRKLDVLRLASHSHRMASHASNSSTSVRASTSPY